MRAIVLLNAGANSNSPPASEVGAALRAAAVDAEVRLTAGADLTAEARRVLAGGNVDAIVAAGGDGTVSAVATALAGTDTFLGVLPCGTLNHFAKDLGLPLTLPEAARVIAAGHVASVDVATLNGRVFINNSSIGLYPHIVHYRDKQIERLGRGKWLAMAAAFVSVFRRFPVVRVRIDTNDTSHVHTTPFVFVGNNEYQMDLFNLGTRRTLARGVLCLHFTQRAGRLGLIHLALRALLNRLDQAADFVSLCAHEVWIETTKKTLRVSLDGETQRLVPPLHYQIRPGALRVLVPPAGEPAAEAQSPASARQSADSSADHD